MLYYSALSWIMRYSKQLYVTKARLERNNKAISEVMSALVANYFTRDIFTLDVTELEFSGSPTVGESTLDTFQEFVTKNADGSEKLNPILVSNDQSGPIQQSHQGGKCMIICYMILSMLKSTVRSSLSWTYKMSFRTAYKCT